MGITDSGLCYKRMLFKSLIFIALAAAALAQTAPEETFVEETFNAASTHVENFMQEETEARKSACVKAADASINKRVERANKHKKEQSQKRAQAAERRGKEQGHKNRERHGRERSHKHRERHNKNVCVVHAYEHNHWRGRAFGWAVRASKQVIRMPRYGRRRGY